MPPRTIAANNKGAAVQRNASESINVLIVCDSTYLGEDDMYALYLAYGLRRAGMTPFVLHTGGLLESLLQRRGLKGAGFKHLAWGAFHLLDYRKIMRLVHVLEPSIVHVVGSRMIYPGLWLAESFRVPCVVSLLRKPSGRSRWSPSVKVARVVLPSQSMRTSLVNDMKVPAGLCTVIQPGVPESEIPEPEEPMVGGLSSVAMAGLLELNRGYRRFLHLVARLIERKREAEFMLLGEGPSIHDLRRAARKKEIARRVSFIQLPREWPEIFRLCTLSVCIEPEYGGEMPILLSMAAGCPVVASSAGAAYDFLTDKETGLLVNGKDENSYIKAIESLLDAPQEAYQMGLAARKAAVEKFPVEKMVAAFKELYRSTIDVRRAGK